jgi:outer membrane protein insertion porin family
LSLARPPALLPLAGMARRRAEATLCCCALLAWVALAAPSWAQAPSAPAKVGARVVEIVVQGAPDPEASSSVQAIFGVREGDVLDRVDVRLGIKRVFLTGPWADVRVLSEPLQGGVRLIVRVVPDLVITEVVVDGAQALPGARLRAAAGLSAGDRLSPPRIEEARLAVVRQAAELGYPRAQVVAELDKLGPSAHRVRFTVNEGEPTRIHRVSIEGDPAMSEQEVLQSLGLKAGQPFDRLGLEEGLVKILQALVAKRHLRARSAIVGVDYGPERKEVSLRVLVDAGPRYRVDFSGNRAVAAAYLKAVMNERVVGALDRNTLQRAVADVERYYREEGFARVKVRTDEVPAYRPWNKDAERVLRFHVDEGHRVEVREIVVEGGTARDGHDIAADLWAFVIGETPTGGLVQRMDVGDLEDLLGRPAGKRDDDRPAQLATVEFEPLPLPSFKRRPPYTAKLFEAARQRIIDRYRKQGFLSVTVDGPELIWLDDGQAVRVRYRLHEGPQVYVSGVRFLPEPSLPIAELLSQVTLEPGEPADLYAVEETRLTLEDNLRDRGFPFARVTEELKRLEDELVEVHYLIEEGPRVRIGELRVSGNRMTQEFAILDRITLSSGDWYSARAIEQSRQRLLRTGLFTAVSIQFLDDRADATARDLLVEVRERPRFSVEAGAGASLEDGPRAFSSFEVRNIAGFGVGLRGRGQVNYPRTFYPLTYGDDPNSPARRFDEEDDPVRSLLFAEYQFLMSAEMPKVYGVPFDARLHVDAVGLREIRPAFTLLKGSVLAGLNLRPLPWLHLGPQLEAETSDFDCPTLTLGRSCGEASVGLTRRTDAGTLAQGTMRLLSSVDLRDDPFRPRSGVFAALSSDLALGAGQLRQSDQGAGFVQSNFVRLSGLLSGYVPIAPQVTLALTARGGNIFMLPTTSSEVGNYVPLFKRFYLGGTGSVRGFITDVILPVDDENWPADQREPTVRVEGLPISLGGNFFMNGRGELRFGLLGNLELGLFVDAGQLANDVRNVSLAGFALGTGFGFRYNTPVGPLAVDLGWRVIDGQRQLERPLWLRSVSNLPGRADLWAPNFHLSIGYF